mmetsp:Transcript_49103/g.137493  ORF Transcript_49103/g.137493 Transcript_49103/m.137493 type:complete len:890 (-) Transcript_49103:183-2852(-)
MPGLQVNHASGATDEQNDGSGDTMEVVRMFKTRHLFVELHEFRCGGWHEMHRWNHGLEEDLVSKQRSRPDVESTSEDVCAKYPSDLELTKRGTTVWTDPHLPTVSLPGMLALREALNPAMCVLDVEGDESLESLADAMLNSLVSLGQLTTTKRASAKDAMMGHLCKKSSAFVARYKARGALGKNAPLPQGGWNRNVSVDSALVSNDALKPDAEEEAVHILVDNADWLSKDILGFARLWEPIDTGFEEHHLTGTRPMCRFIVMVIGPHRPEEPRRHTEMGQAVAALLQDDSVVAAAYEAPSPAELMKAIDERFWQLRLMPGTTRPTDEGIQKRAELMLTQMTNVQMASAAAKLKRTQTQKWSGRQVNPFKRGISVDGFVLLLQQFAIPLLTGILVAIMAANLDKLFYEKWFSHGGHADGAGGDHRRMKDSSVDGNAEHPTILGLSFNGHDVTLHFIVNDVFMCLFFGLAAKEICEAFQPGGSLYPPTRTTVNVLAATIGGIVGPVLVYVITLAGLDAFGMLGDTYGFREYAIGWGIPTATDISLAWVTALCVFGQGHPAINFLLLLAIVDDGIGLLIIACAYPDPSNPVNPVWLLLVLVGCAVAFVLRRLRCVRWQMYVFLAGPFAWVGLLYAALHPSLALVFIVPFMPLHMESDILSLYGAEHDPAQKHHGKGASPLHAFEESVKLFVDFVVLFSFGVVNAGVQVDSFGALTFVVLLALVAGKTLGILVASKVASLFGCPPPAGMGSGVLAIVGFIASAGLTVALFISGEAFKEYPTLAAEAKMGALLSVGVALLAIAASSVLRPWLSKCLGDPLKTAPSRDVTSMTDVAGYDETLEDIIVASTVDKLRRIQQAEQAVENKAKITRARTLEKINERKKASDAGDAQFST